MRIAVSSIAWKYDQAITVAGALRRNGAHCIEASPGLFSKPMAELMPKDVQHIRSFWEDAGLPVVAMQSLLFGGPEVNLFADQNQRDIMAEYLTMVIRVAGQLGGGPLIFGSPKNRLAGNLASEQAFDIAVDFLTSLADIAETEGCIICIEANAQAYNCDFITHHHQAVQLVKAINRQGIGFNLDTGVMQMNNESPKDIQSLLLENDTRPAHIHISEPFLAPVSGGNHEFHTQLRSVLDCIQYSGVVSIEMKAPQQITDVATVLEDALRCVNKIYGESYA